MKRAALTAGIALAVLFAGAVVWRLSSPPRPSEASRAPAAAQPIVRVDSEGRAAAGVAVARVEAERLGGELEAFGRVLDPLPLADALVARGAARATLTAARAEVRRVRALHRGDANASARELEVAEASFRRAGLDLAAADARLTSDWGDALASRPDLDALSERLVQRRVALARLDLPAGAEPVGAPSAAWAAPATSEAPATRAARLVGPAPATDPATQGHGYLVLIEDEPPPPGTALAGRLVFPERAGAGVMLPRAAVVWHNGHSIVYVERGEGRFERREVSLRRALDGGWLATGPLAPGERVVVSGAAMLLSSELLRGPAAD